MKYFAGFVALEKLSKWKSFCCKSLSARNQSIISDLSLKDCKVKF